MSAGLLSAVSAMAGGLGGGAEPATTETATQTLNVTTGPFGGGGDGNSNLLLLVVVLLAAALLIRR